MATPALKPKDQVNGITIGKQTLRIRRSEFIRELEIDILAQARTETGPEHDLRFAFRVGFSHSLGRRFLQAVVSALPHWDFVPTLIPIAESGLKKSSKKKRGACYREPRLKSIRKFCPTSLAVGQNFRMDFKRGSR